MQISIYIPVKMKDFFYSWHSSKITLPIQGKYFLLYMKFKNEYYFQATPDFMTLLLKPLLIRCLKLNSDPFMTAQSTLEMTSLLVLEQSSILHRNTSKIFSATFHACLLNFIWKKSSNWSLWSSTNYVLNLCISKEI